MAKIVLGKLPETFKRVVKFKLVDGSEAQIEVDFIYRTRNEFGAFVDSLNKRDKDAAASAAPSSEPVEFSLADVMEKTGASNADYIMQVVKGWNLDEEFSLDNVEQLADECPAAVQAIMDQYRAAITQGRLGN